jgi:transcriptional regulator with XRE-family HTH domain
MTRKKRAEKQLSFADQIRAAIRASGVSQYRLSKDTGLDQAMLSRFMNGKRWPSEANLNALCRYLGLSVAGPSDGRQVTHGARGTEHP